MNISTHGARANVDAIAAIRAALAERPDGVLENLAADHHVSYRAVLDCLAFDQRLRAPPGAFDAIWADVTTWGPIMFIVHTENGVFETKGSPPAAMGEATSI